MIIPFDPPFVLGAAGLIITQPRAASGDRHCPRWLNRYSGNKVHRWIVGLLWLSAIAPQPTWAQSSRSIVAGAGMGGTYYCIVSRCGTGVITGAVVGIEATRALALEAGLRRHFCTDCGRFLIGDLTVLLQHTGPLVSPFVAAGLSYSSDNDFMGQHFGLSGGVGTSIRVKGNWGFRIEIRGRRVGRGDAMGDVSLSVMRRFR